MSLEIPAHVVRNLGEPPESCIFKNCQRHRNVNFRTKYIFKKKLIFNIVNLILIKKSLYLNVIFSELYLLKNYTFPVAHPADVLRGANELERHRT